MTEEEVAKDASKACELYLIIITSGLPVLEG